MEGQGQVPPTHPPTKQDPPPDQLYTGPNYQGFVFTLPSSSNKPTHYLTIATQSVDGSLIKTAFITGTWQGDGTPKAMNGRIGENGASINCGWVNDPNNPTVQNNLVGTLSSYSTTGKFGQVQGQPSAFLEGTVTSFEFGTTTVRPGDGPGNVSGEGYGPAPPPPSAIGEGSLLGSAS